MKARTWHEITRDGFASPGPYPKRKRGETEAAWLARIAAHGWLEHAHRAVHGAWPEPRRDFAQMVGERLQSGAELPEPAREWLLYVLGDLLRRDAIPTKYHGTPADPRRLFERRAALAHWWAADELAHPERTKTQRLDFAALALGHEARTLRADTRATYFAELLDFARQSAADK